MISNFGFLHLDRYTKDIPFWIWLAQKQNGPILELGCGTGRVLLELAKRGYTTFGLDNDENALAILNHNIHNRLLPLIHLFLSDLSSFHLTKRFPLIILPCNTFSTLNTKDRDTALSCIHQHLTSSGIFATSLPNPAILSKLSPGCEPEVEEVFLHPRSGDPIQVSSDWQKSSGGIQMRWFYDYLFSDGRIERQTVVSYHFIVTPSIYMKEFRKVGFNHVTIYGDFDCSAYTPESPHLIIAARK